MTFSLNCFAVVKYPPVNAEDMGVGLGRSPGIGNGNPLQYSCLDNSKDRGAWWATVHGVVKSSTQLSTHTHTRGRNSLDTLHVFKEDPYWCPFLLLSSFFLKYIYLAALGLSCDTQDLQFSLWHVGSSSLTRDWTWAPCIGSRES